MNYQALYRKYRPKDLNEIYGQQIAVRILQNAVKKNKFAHAYLFTGPRGCGKTSAAKIMARLINCENKTNGKICGKCNNCINSNVNNCVDILEIDAASNNGVDEIRELKSKINLIPSILKYKVYIIDEVHMLSVGAFNALLKTLEEPPEHVVFILATTELNKVPSTIVSRCQTIEFKKINREDMFNCIKEISNKENIRIEDEAIKEISNLSDGGLRDAIGLLDLATSYSNEIITEEDIININGSVAKSEIDNFSNLIIEKKFNEILDTLNSYYNNGKDLVKITEQVITNLKNKMINNNDTNICFILDELINSLYKLKQSTLDKIILEIAFFKICKDDNNNSDIKNEINIANHEVFNEKKDINIENKKINTTNITNNYSLNADLKKIRINNTFVDVNKKSLNEYKKIWNNLNDYTFDKNYGALVCELIDATPVAASDSHLILNYIYDSFVDKGNMYVDKYENVLKNTIGIDVKIVFVTNEEWLEIRKKYIENIKNNVKYNYIEEKKSNDKKSELDNVKSDDLQKSQFLERAEEIFDANKIEIRES